MDLRLDAELSLLVWGPASATLWPHCCLWDLAVHHAARLAGDESCACATPTLSGGTVPVLRMRSADRRRRRSSHFHPGSSTAHGSSGIARLLDTCAILPSDMAAVGRRGLLRVVRLAALCPQNYSNTSSSSPTYPGIVESTEEFKFVKRLIPPTTVPVPPKHDHYPTPSGWCPPQDPPPDLPYLVRRSRMHNIPVYTDITHGNRKMTVIRKIEGDIWTLDKDVKEFLAQVTGKTPLTQVNEVTMSLRIKGYFDKELKTWLLEKGF